MLFVHLYCDDDDDCYCYLLSLYYNNIKGATGHACTLLIGYYSNFEHYIQKDDYLCISTHLYLLSTIMHTISHLSIVISS